MNDEESKTKKQIVGEGKRQNNPNEYEDERFIKAALKKILSKPIPNSMEQLKIILEELDIDQNCSEGIALAMVLNAMNGNKTSADWVRDTIGEKQKEEKGQIGSVVILSGDDDIAD